MRTASVLLVLAAALAASAAAPAARAPSVQVTIRHQVRGCHTWSVDGSAFRASQSLRVQRGATVTVTNDDIMEHTLLQQRGPRVAFTNLATTTGMMGGGGMMGSQGSFAPGVLGRMGASAAFTLRKPGTYRFTTRGGEDYMDGMPTVGPDNTLELTIVVA